VSVPIEGKSNRAIAKLLVLSEKMIANHLSRIYGKVGLENRTGATAFAIRHGLA
jgi:DNA-binding NarL/FixJ family response regulator